MGLRWVFDGFMMALWWLYGWFLMISWCVMIFILLVYRRYDGFDGFLVYKFYNGFRIGYILEKSLKPTRWTIDEPLWCIYLKTNKYWSYVNYLCQLYDLEYHLGLSLLSIENPWRFWWAIVERNGWFCKGPVFLQWLGIQMMQPNHNEDYDEAYWNRGSNMVTWLQHMSTDHWFSWKYSGRFLAASRWAGITIISHSQQRGICAILRW